VRKEGVETWVKPRHHQTAGGGGWLECDQEKRGQEEGMGRKEGGGVQGDDAEEDEVNRMGRCIWGCKGSRGGGRGLWFVAVAGAEAVPVTAVPPVPQLATSNTSTKHKHKQHRRKQQA